MAFDVLDPTLTNRIAPQRQSRDLHAGESFREEMHSLFSGDLAAKSACYYPLAEERQETVVRNLQSAVRGLGLVSQYDEERLREPCTTIRELWANELLPPEEIEAALATY